MTIGRKFTYFTESEFMAKYLLKQCQLTHEFYVNIQRKFAFNRIISFILLLIIIILYVLLNV